MSNAIPFPTLAQLTDVQALTGLNVMSYGAKGDGTTDDAAAIRAAVAALASTGGVVYLPKGNYLCGSAIGVLPKGVSLCGTYRGSVAHAGNVNAASGVSDPTKFITTPGADGTCISVTANAAASTPSFIVLSTNCGLTGICFYYPNQAKLGNSGNAPVVYPWTVEMQEGNEGSIIGCEFLNSYQAIFVNGMWRPTIRDIRGQPYFQGLKVDKCFDSARAENVHFECYWDAVTTGGSFYCPWSLTNGIAFQFLRCDLANFDRLFAYGYHFAYVLQASDNTAANGPWATMTACNSDTCNYGIYAVNVQAYGVQWSCSSFTACVTEAVHTTAAFSGRISFDNCFFSYEAGAGFNLLGSGDVMATGCTFNNVTGASSNAAVVTVAGGIEIIACNFNSPQPPWVLGSGTSWAYITARCRAGQTAYNNMTNAATYHIEGYGLT